GGAVVDTNSAWLSRQLSSRGVFVTHKATVGDTREDIIAVLAAWDGQHDMVLITGGLGPTHDDVTKAALCDYFGSGLTFNEQYWEELVERFKKRGLDIPDNNKTQAQLPDLCETLANSVGTALGMKFTSEKTIFISLPGVPAEMKAIVSEHVLPAIGGEPIAETTLRVTGLSESALSTQLDAIISAAQGVTIGILPSLISTDLRIVAQEPGSAGADAVADVVDRMAELLGDKVFARNGQTMQETVGALLKGRGETVALAESCSGGLAASWLTDVPGSSDYFLGAVVAYSDAVKQSALGVSAQTLSAHGAVSEQVALEMAGGIRLAMGATWGVATTGISGPDGGSAQKPVGLVHIAVAGIKRSEARKFQLVPRRLDHKQMTAQAALNLLRLELLSHD
ncbi:MAG: CinA family nicotinamide mononucleotide deamidase-related protein, partial [Candidatus Marinimicrobia bacterium]|nr:CinA family nicotinamide mononucleotide deamidase-related protein [Candidatus Neomarinimicrobiota bacterium]